MRHLTTVLVASLLSCVTLPRARGAESSFRELALPRAAFELDCPAEQVAVSVLRDSDPEPESRGMAGAQVGATGCGKRAVYVFTDSAGWVVDSASESPSPSK